MKVGHKQYRDHCTLYNEIYCPLENLYQLLLQKLLNYLKDQGINIDVLLMHEFYTQIKQSGHYWLIDNIENKNYLGTRHLIYLKKKVI